MRREQKYPNHSTFQFYNANPKNRAGGDCVVRAICTALNQSWEQTIRELTEVGIKHGYVLNDKKTYEKYLQSKGWIKHKQPRNQITGKKYTGKEFCRMIRPDVNYIAHIGGHHMVAIINAKVYDIWDSTEGCIGNYWTKG